MQRVWSAGSSRGRDTYRPKLSNSSPRSSYKRDSAFSNANSVYSQDSSMQHMLADMNLNNISEYPLLDPPKAPFINNLSRDNISLGSSTNLSLSVNYIPSKFSEFRNRKTGKYVDEPSLPKRGGGLQAFKTSEARMPQGKGRLRWNKFKWILFVTNSLLTIGSIGALIICLLTWFDIWQHADVIRTGNSIELILSTVAASTGILTSLIGWAGILLNNRSFLAWYTFLTWVTFALLLIPGYLTYKRRTFNLEGKIDSQWSRSLKSSDRLRIQNQLQCCGYFNPFIEATISQTCYARTILPGCKGPYLAYESQLLGLWFKAVFLLVPAHILVMVAGLLCSNHITYRFGKGMMPEAYRLNMNTMAVIMDNYANQLADQYGIGDASNILKSTGSQSPFNNSSYASTPHEPPEPEHDIPLDPFSSTSGLHANNQPRAF